MAMNGYQYWVERHKLLIALAEKKEALAERPEQEALDRAVELEREFREKLDAIYAEARPEFEPSDPPR